MDTVRDLLMKKTGKALTFLAVEFLALSIGERLPTFAELGKRSEFSRGTLQNAMKSLSSLGAVEFKNRGHKGSFLIAKDTDMLLRCSGIARVSGVMPLPYTKVYEGLATGLFNTINESGKLTVDIAFLRGSGRRIALVCEGRYDFAITSRLAAEAAAEKGKKIEIIANFGPGSYLSGHNIIFRAEDATDIKDGMRVGVDRTSLDHTKLTELMVGEHNVTMVPVNYNQVVALIQQSEIDAAVWNIDHIVESHVRVNYKPIEFSGDTEAVVVIREDESALRAVLNEYLDLHAISAQQRGVMDGTRYPNY